MATNQCTIFGSMLHRITSDIQYMERRRLDMITCTCTPTMFQLFSNAVCRGKCESSASHKRFCFWFLSILFTSIQYLQLVKTKNPKELCHLYFNIHICSTVFQYMVALEVRLEDKICKLSTSSKLSKACTRAMDANLIT